MANSNASRYAVTFIAIAPLLHGMVIRLVEKILHCCMLCSCPADIDLCAGNPCDSTANAIAGTCLDVAAPDVGHTCVCIAGFDWTGDGCIGESGH